jgi:energy-coupling factor transport system ATP-binding protein
MAFIELSQVTFSYGKKKPAVKNINLALDKRGITAIVGPNGSGKTTLTKLIMGILQPNEGIIRLQGRLIAEYTLAEIGRCIGYVFQNPDLQLFCTTVAEEIGFGLVNQGCDPAIVTKKVDFYLKYFELAVYRNVFPLHLSQGEKQRLAIAAVLANDPEFLILDEPTIGLDAYHKGLLGSILHQAVGLDKGILLVSHDEVFVNKLAERIISMQNGVIQSDCRKGENTGGA